MATVQNSATPAVTPSTSLAADAAARAGQLRQSLASVSRTFNPGDAVAAAGYVLLGFYGFVFVANAALGY